MATDPTSVADIFDLFRSARPGLPTHAVQQRRLNQIVANRAIPFAQKSPTEFREKLAQLTPDERDYVLRRLAQGLPATTERLGPSGRVRQVWFPVELQEPTSEEILAKTQARGESMQRQNFVPERTRLHTLLDGRQAGVGAMLAIAGSYYGSPMRGGK